MDLVGQVKVVLPAAQLAGIVADLTALRIEHAQAIGQVQRLLDRDVQALDPVAPQRVLAVQGVIGGLKRGDAGALVQAVVHQRMRANARPDHVGQKGLVAMRGVHAVLRQVVVDPFAQMRQIGRPRAPKTRQDQVGVRVPVAHDVKGLATGQPGLHQGLLARADQGVGIAELHPAHPRLGHGVKAPEGARPVANPQGRGVQQAHPQGVQARQHRRWHAVVVVEPHGPARVDLGHALGIEHRAFAVTWVVAKEAEGHHVAREACGPHTARVGALQLGGTGLGGLRQTIWIDAAGGVGGFFHAGSLGALTAPCRAHDQRRPLEL